MLFNHLQTQKRRFRFFLYVFLYNKYLSLECSNSRHSITLEEPRYSAASCSVLQCLINLLPKPVRNREKPSRPSFALLSNETQNQNFSQIMVNAMIYNRFHFLWPIPQFHPRFHTFMFYITKLWRQLRFLSPR